VTDTHGNTAQCAFTVTVQDTTPPSLQWDVLPASTPVAINTPVVGKVQFSDNAVVSSVGWDWGDGVGSIGDLSVASGSGTDERTHSYTVPGVYAVTVTANDQTGNSTAISLHYIVAYEPNGDFVTGGGWITSPRGAYLVEPTLTGRASFGFNSKYRSGAAEPSGVTQFQLQMANFNFHADVYQWLVVAGAKAQYKGLGTVNGRGQYGFLLTAMDGSTAGTGVSDKLRIQIWDATSSILVYDNQLGAANDALPTTALGGGNIVIHTK